jgi:hypothetical protein
LPDNKLHEKLTLLLVELPCIAKVEEESHKLCVEGLAKAIAAGCI